MFINVCREEFIAPFDYLNGEDTIRFTKAQLMWAAYTIGRKNRYDVLRHGVYSKYEKIYRTAMIQANLDIGRDNFLYKTAAYNSLDRSEKSAVSYFIGMTFSKLIAYITLGFSYLMHLEVYEDHFIRRHGLRYRPGNSRPDLIGFKKPDQFVVFESKGRTGTVDDALFETAKKQLRQVVSIGGNPPMLSIASATYFSSNEQLRLKWIDPDEKDRDNKMEIVVSEKQILSDYYKPFIDLIHENGNDVISDSSEEDYYLIRLRELDMMIGVHKRVVEFYNSPNVSHSNLSFLSGIPEISESQSLFKSSDGIMIKLGESWDHLFTGESLLNT